MTFFRSSSIGMAYLDVPPNPRKLRRGADVIPLCSTTRESDRTHLFEPDGSPSIGILTNHRNARPSAQYHPKTHDRFTHKELHEELDRIQIERYPSFNTNQKPRKKKRTHAPNRHDPTPVLPTSSDPPHATRVESLTKLDDGDRTRSVRVHAMKPVPQPRLITVSHHLDRSIMGDVLRVRIRRRSESKARTTRIARAHGDARIP